MTDYKKLVEALRLCADYGASENDAELLFADAADAIEELSENWKYCSDLLNVALKHGCKSMTALLKLYNMEVRRNERLQEAD